jgi:chemotaxis protein methyltransferase CheR
MGAAIPMGAGEFRLLRDLIRDYAGILYADENSFLLQRRLEPRLEALGLRSFGDYYDYLTATGRSDGDRARELDEICERIVTRETYLFRESYQLAAFREGILPQVHKARPRGQRLSVWSAGCSTGEEPYTIAILLRESGLFDSWDVHVVGTDISQTALASASAGVFGPSSFRQTESAIIERYFHPAPGGRLEVRDEVRRLVTFSQLNLQDSAWSLPGEPFDAIFCRNVLIYFDRNLRGPVIYRFADKLLPGGYLLLGHSESLLDTASPFEVAHLNRQLVYRRRAVS